MEHTYDYVIVGGGTSGIIAAVRLAERSAASVCMIEAGPAGDRDPRILSYRSWVDLLGTEYDYDYEIAAQARGNSRIRHSRARVLGGCSSHNSVIAIPSPDDDMRLWERLGATGWGPEGTRPFFRRVAERVHVTIPDAVNGCASDFMAAAAQAGYAEVDLRYPEFGEGVAWLPLNILGETRQSSAVAYLFPLERRPANLTVLTETRALRLALDDNGEALGVETDRGLVRARAEVILCAGAFDSPRLLMLSGVGPAEHLRAVGVPVRHDLPGVGENLQDHIEAVAMWEAARPVPEASTQHWENGLFARTLPGDGGFDMMMHFGTERYYVDFAALGYPVDPTDHAFCMTPNVARPRSAGTVRLRSADPADPPLIDPRYFTDPDGADERILVEGIRLARRIAEQPALRPWVGRELAPGPHIQSDEDLGRYVRLTSNTVYHPSSTCHMGAADDPLAVVDPALRVRGLGRLRVADASVFPSMIGVNLCITCMMVGEKCAELVLADAA